MHILSGIYCALRGLWHSYIKDAGVLDRRFIELVVLPGDGSVRAQLGHVGVGG